VITEAMVVVGGGVGAQMVRAGVVVVAVVVAGVAGQVAGQVGAAVVRACSTRVVATLDRARHLVEPARRRSQP
jgi:hypothetical protein